MTVWKNTDPFFGIELGGENAPREDTPIWVRIQSENDSEIIEVVSLEEDGNNLILILADGTRSVVHLDNIMGWAAWPAPKGKK